LVARKDFTPALHERKKTSEKQKYAKACNDIYILGFGYIAKKMLEVFAAPVKAKINSYIVAANAEIVRIGEPLRGDEEFSQNTFKKAQLEHEVRRGTLITDAVDSFVKCLRETREEDAQKFQVVKPYFMWETEGNQAYVVIMVFACGVPLDVVFYAPSVFKIENGKPSYALMKVNTPHTHAIDLANIKATQGDVSLFEGYEVYSRPNTAHLYPPSLPFAIFESLLKLFAARVKNGGAKIMEHLLTEH